MTRASERYRQRQLYHLHRHLLQLRLARLCLAVLLHPIDLVAAVLVFSILDILTVLVAFVPVFSIPLSLMNAQLLTEGKIKILTLTP